MGNRKLQGKGAMQVDVQELLECMNGLINAGHKVSEAEKELGFGDGQARKKLSKAGYKFDRKINKYIQKDDMVTGSNSVTQQQENDVTHIPIVTGSNGVMPRQKPRQEVVQKQVFSIEQVDILHQMIGEYIVRQQIQAVSEQDKGKTINRNVRVYETQFEAFANWCKVNNVTQADALYKAIDMIMNDNPNKLT